MASLVLGAAGAYVGFLVGGPTGAQVGFAVGSAIGSSMTKLPDIQGPRLNDLKVQSSTYGKSIPIYRGIGRGTGEVMWASELIETEHEEDAGGKGGPSQSVSTYTYSINCAVAVCAGEISGIRKIWANSNLIFDQSAGNTGPTGQSSNIRVYTGSETQVADALLESYLGVGNVPGHRGLAYVVFENLQLEKFGNRMPNFSFEVVADGEVSNASVIKVAEYSDATMTHPFIDGILLAISNENGTGNPGVFRIVDLISRTERTLDIGDIPCDYMTMEIEYIDYYDILTGIAVNEIWIGYDTIYSGYSDVVAVAFDAASLVFKRYITAGSPGFNFIGNMHYDKISKQVLFASDNTTVGNGYNSLDPFTLVWSGAKGITASGQNTEFTGHGATGKNSIMLSHRGNFVGLFKNAIFFRLIPASSGVRYIAYDSTRERYAWHDRNDAGKMVFKTVDDDSDNDVLEHAPVNSAVGGASHSTLDYFPIVDKYFYTNGNTLYKLNADTFEVEESWAITGAPYTGIEAREIAGMQEYVAMRMTTLPSTGIKLFPLTDRITPNTVPLSEIVTDICARVGLASGDIDVTGLTDEVEGYVISQQMTARAAIDGLQASYYFDAVESD